MDARIRELEQGPTLRCPVCSQERRAPEAERDKPCALCVEADADSELRGLSAERLSGEVEECRTALGELTRQIQAEEQVAAEVGVDLYSGDRDDDHDGQRHFTRALRYAGDVLRRRLVRMERGVKMRAWKAKQQ